MKTTTPFIDDGEKMRDFFHLSKEEFLESYSYLTEEEYDETERYVKKNKIEPHLYVCDRCLSAIIAHEGNQVVRCWDVDSDNEIQSKCDWCGEFGFCELYELI